MAATILTSSLGRETRVIGLITAAHFMSHFYQFVVPALMLSMVDAYSIDYLDLGLLVSAFAAATAFSQTPVGFVVDRLGARPVLILGLGMLSLSIGLYAIAPSYGWLIVLALIGGTANSVFHPSDFAILSGSVDPSRLGRAFSIHAVSGNLGWAAAPALLVPIAEFADVRTAFAVAGAMGVFVTILLLLQAAFLLDENDTEAASEGGSKRKSSGSVKDGLGLLLSRAALLLFFFQLVYATAFAGVRTFSIPALTALHGLTEVVVASALTGYLIGASFGNLVGGWLVDKTGRPHVVFTSSILLVTALVVVVGSIDLTAGLLMVVFVTMGLLQGSLLPARDVLVRAISPPGQIGKMFGFTSSGLALGSAITPPIFGWIMDNGNPAWIYYVSAVCMLAALLTYTETRRDARR